MDAGDSSDPYCKIALGKDVLRNGRNTSPSFYEWSKIFLIQLQFDFSFSAGQTGFFKTLPKITDFDFLGHRIEHYIELNICSRMA